MAIEPEHMDEDRRQAKQMERMTHAIIEAIGAQDGGEDVVVVMAAMGAAAGALAMASGRPQECMVKMIGVAEMVMSGELLDPE